MTAQDNSNQAVTHAQRLAAAQEGNRRGVEKRNDRWLPPPPHRRAGRLDQ